MRAMKIVVGLTLACVFFVGCGNPQNKYPIKIGFSMDTLRAARWGKDRDLFTKKCNELGVGVLVQSAESNDALQITQSENLLSQGIKALVVVPHNDKSCATIVEMAHKSGVPVLAYDRLITGCDLDMYVSFDSVKVGEMMADYFTKLKPRGNYVLMGGAPTDHNAILVREGHNKGLAPFVKSGAIKIVGDQWSNDWLPVNALKNMENILTQNNNKVDAVLDSYDGTAGGTIQALTEQKLEGKVLVAGQDAELSACQRLLAGTQTLTIYKPISLLAAKAGEIAVKMAKKEPITEKTVPIDNGKIKVPGVLLEPIPVDKNNLMTTVIADGYHKMEDVYKDVPKDQWPKKP